MHRMLLHQYVTLDTEISGFAGKCQGGVFAVLGRFVGCWGRAYWAVERLPAGADRGFEAGSVKKYGVSVKR